MTTHELKTWPEPFAAIKRGDKTYEIREDDRGFEPGDTLILMEWDPDSKTYSGRQITVVITYKTCGGDWGIPAHLCILAIHRVITDGTPT